MANKTVFGYGVNDLTRGSVSSGQIPFYRAWKDMLRRCYSEAYQKEKPTYIGCSVCEEWLTLSRFKEWHDVNYIEGYHLDKDLLVEGNKVYSPDTCVYVSKQLNKFFNDHRNRRGEYPIGVSKSNRQIPNYIARINKFGENVVIGTFPTIEEASKAYQIEKRKYVIEFCGRRRGVDCDRVLDIILERWNTHECD